MTKNVRRLLCAASAAAAVLCLGAAPAMAQGNPSGNRNPYAYIYYAGQGGACIETYKAPPANGGPAPGSSARGGNPGYDDNRYSGNDC